MRNLCLRPLALLFIWLLGIEIIFRMLGFFPADEQVNYNPLLFEKDSTLGWIPKPGTYFMIPESRPDLGAHRVSINEDNSRWTGREAVGTVPNIFLFGDSIIFGFGLDDKGSIGFQLQKAIVHFNVLNFGVNGYGSYQAYLFMKRKLPSLARKGDIVVLFLALYMHQRDDRQIK